MSWLLHNLRHALRGLARSPTFSAVVVLTLGLGIASNLAVFTAFDAAVLRALPYREPDRLVMLWQNNTLRNRAQELASVPNFKDWQAQNRTFEEMAVFHWTRHAVTGHGEPVNVRGIGVDWNFFALLGTEPLLGRTFAPDGVDESDDRLVLSYRFWQRHFGGDPSVVGGTINLNGKPNTIIGVMPPRFAFPEVAELWVPRWRVDYYENDRAAIGFHPIGRLKPGVTLAQAREDMNVIARRLEQEYPEVNTGCGVTLLPFREHVLGQIEAPLLRILLASGLVVLIACANVANLLLARGLGQTRELAVRSALGAGRLRLMGYRLTESLLFAILGSGVGLILGFWVLRLLVAVNPGGVLAVEHVHIHASTVGYTVGLTLLAALLCSIGPLLQILRSQVAAELHAGGARTGTSARLRIFQRAVVTVQIALALLLLTGAGLLTKSFVKIQQVPVGYDEDHLLTILIALPPNPYGPRLKKLQFFGEAIERLRDLPDVVAVAATSALSMLPEPYLAPFTVAGRDPADYPDRLLHEASVTTDYLKVMGVPLTEGRFFGSGDVHETPPVALISQKLARELWPGASAVGKRIAYWDPTYGNQPPDYAIADVEIIGVVGDSRIYRRDAQPYADLLVPFAQSPRIIMRLLIRTQGEPLALAPAARQILRTMDPDLPIAELKPMTQLLSEKLGPRRLHLALFSLFSMVGLVLAITGVFSGTSHHASERLHELAIRSTLGARGKHLVFSVMKEWLVLITAGFALGLFLAWWFRLAIEALLFETSPGDPWMYFGAMLLVAGTTTIAAYLPVRRAVRLEPMVILRTE